MIDLKAINILHGPADKIFQQCSPLSRKMKEKTEYPAQKEQNEVHYTSRQVILLNVFVSDTDSGIQCTLSKFVRDTKLCDVVDILEAKDSIQVDLARQVHVNLMKFNKAKWKVLHVDQRNP